jgi:hypothetical protein
LKQSDKQKFIDLLGGVYALYRADLSPQVVEIWWRALAAYDIAAVSEALTKHAMNPDTGQFVPKPADVVRMLGGTTKDAAILAWARADQAVRSIGSWTTVVFDDPIIMRVIEDLGGWVWLCEQTEREWPFVEKRFCDHYRVYRGRGEVPEHPRKLPGRTDIANVANGFPDMQPALIGDPWVCGRVLEGKAEVGLLTEKAA